MAATVQRDLAMTTSSLVFRPPAELPTEDWLSFMEPVPAGPLVVAERFTNRFANLNDQRAQRMHQPSGAGRTEPGDATHGDH